jgi:hypothetical protein
MLMPDPFRRRPFTRTWRKRAPALPTQLDGRTGAATGTASYRIVRGQPRATQAQYAQTWVTFEHYGNQRGADMGILASSEGKLRTNRPS